MLTRFPGAAMRIVCSLNLAILFLWLASVQPVCGQSAKPLETQIDAIFQTVTAAADPGCAVLVKKDGQALFAKGYGVRDLRTRTKNDPRTNFRQASLTKQFTAMAVMLLVHDGKLHYDDRLTDIFPEFPAYGKPITMRHLLTHTSGLPEYDDLMQREEKANRPIWSAQHQIEDAEVLALLERETAGVFPPGSSWAYSNSGYVVLGLVIAKVSGMPYRDFLQKRIFTPAGMTHSIVYQKGINEVVDRAFGHSQEAGKFVESDQSATSATLGDSAVYSNLEDLAKWDAALANHLLLSEKEMAPARVPVKLADGSATNWPKSVDDPADTGRPVSYGFGWFLDPWEGHARMYHTGGTRGFRTVIQRFTADNVSVVVLCNRLDLDPKTLSQQAAALLLSK
jgi:CubicO group peptidase (beta-lactamase class C family)